MDEQERKQLANEMTFGLRLGTGARALERSRVRVRPVTLRRCFVLTKAQQMRRIEKT